MGRILFVEDNLELVEELAELLKAERPEVETAFAVDIPTSLAKMDKEEKGFDAVVLDIMLPAWPGAHSLDEGIYLAAWILGELQGLPPSLHDRPRPNWLDEAPPAVIVLTSRTSVSIEDAWKELTGKESEFLIIERLQDDAYAHCRTILEHNP